MTAPALSTFANGVGSLSGDNLNTFEQTANTYADLRAFTGTTGSQVFLRGGSSAGDGGQGVFYWSAASTAADNGSTVIAPSGATTGRWLRLANTNVTTVSCTASGTNTVVLTPVAGSMAVTSLSNYLKVRWVQPNTSNGAVTLQFSSFSALPLYLAGTTATQASTGDLTQNILYEADYNSALNGGNGGWVVTSATGATAAQTSFNLGLINGYLVWTVGSNALTVAVKTATGADPSSSSPVSVQFRNATATDGSYSTVNITAALSVTISNGSTLGTANSVPFKVWCLAINNAGAVELALVQTVTNNTTSLDVAIIRDDQIISTTAEGGAGAADAPGVPYSTTARSNVACRFAGYAEWGSGLATAGAWASGPTKVQLYEAAVPLPGQIVQTRSYQDAAVATGTTVLPFDDSIPQNTEGDQYMSQSIAPASAANIHDIKAFLHLAESAAGVVSAALFQDSVADALTADAVGDNANGVMQSVILSVRRRANTTSVITYKVRAGPSSAATTTFNGTGGARRFGGVGFSTLQIDEIAT